MDLIYSKENLGIIFNKFIKRWSRQRVAQTIRPIAWNRLFWLFDVQTSSAVGEESKS